MWETVKLGNVLTIARGGSPRPIKSFITEDPDGINWIKIGDTTEGGRYIESTKQKIKPSGINRSRYVEHGDFLLSNSMSFGRPYILKTDGCIHDGWLVLSNYEANFQPDYLYYLLSSSIVQGQFETLARGSTVRNLNTELVSSVTVTIPPLSEQKRIVERLDKAFAEIDKAINAAEAKEVECEKLHQKLIDEAIICQKSAVINAKLGDLAKFLDYRGKTPRKAEAGMPLLTAKNVRMGTINKDPEEFVSEETYRQHMTRGFADVGDVVITTEAPLGLIAQIENKEIALGQRLITLQIKNNSLEKSFLMYFLMSTEAQQRLEADGTGATVKGIKTSRLRNFDVKFPNDLQEQKQVVERLKALESHLRYVRQYCELKSNNLDSLKSAVLRKELSPSEPA